MLKAIYVLNIELEVLTGLFIGGTENGFDIGGADSNVVRNPLTNEPYIPGSSIKGKLKSLLKYRHGKLNAKKTDLVFSDAAMTNIFEPTTSKEVNVTRAIFRDFTLTSESKEHLQKQLGGIGQFTEIKAENTIDVLKGTAANPRYIERVPAGAKFEGQIVLNVFDGDDEKRMKDTIIESLKLLELNYLGGSGTRGYGRVKAQYSGFEKVDL
ncbi:MAG: type III-A CRISPR-associated RAMP protein Csm3 [Erysipelotrichaceae bacterium]|nr:type III-A CRISPR-associated RAMP protein Csm3 [Erysipelotrichaceae bacterium]